MQAPSKNYRAILVICRLVLLENFLCIRIAKYRLLVNHYVGLNSILRNGLYLIDNGKPENVSEEEKKHSLKSSPGKLPHRPGSPWCYEPCCYEKKALSLY